jgi:glutamine cyclotransferase
MGIQRIISKYSGLILAGILLLTSCNNNTQKTDVKIKTQKNTAQQYLKAAKIITPTNGSEFTIGDSLVITLKMPKQNIDSLTVQIDGYNVNYKKINDSTITIQTKNLNVGKHNINIFTHKQKNQKNDYVVCFFKSDITPQIITPQIIKTYPHNTKSYTQGLLFDNGIMYESTGQWGESATKQIDLETGKTLKQYSLPSNVFGEGIVVYKNEIIQLTWKSRTAYVIDKQNFNLKNTFTYDTEGWGITNYNNDKLIMSDGSNKLYIIEPNTFDVINEIEVYDNKSAVYQLNELEYINGLIYANIYLSNKIAIINPENGKVLKYINTEKIIPPKYRNENDLVLNGIAYNKLTNKLYITGKRWNVLFEIKITK